MAQLKGEGQGTHEQREKIKEGVIKKKQKTVRERKKERGRETGAGTDAQRRVNEPEIPAVVGADTRDTRIAYPSPDDSELLREPVHE